MTETADPQKARLAEGRKLFAQDCRFILAAMEPVHLDDPQIPRFLSEVAFWGRSNVGKSSLINALTGRAKLARASNTPGRTQQIVFFNLGERLLLVDLPGYGHASAPKKTIQAWTRLIHHYLETRGALRCVMLLFDGRHGPLKADQEIMGLLDRAAINYQVVLTKADDLKPAEREARGQEIEKMLKKHPAARPDVLWTSAVRKDGLEAVQALLADYAAAK